MDLDEYAAAFGDLSEEDQNRVKEELAESKVVLEAWRDAAGTAGPNVLMACASEVITLVAMFYRRHGIMTEEELSARLDDLRDMVLEQTGGEEDKGWPLH